jgi:tetratricopeptide (TPR) repeat protein
LVAANKPAAPGHSWLNKNVAVGNRLSMDEKDEENQPMSERLRLSGYAGLLALLLAGPCFADGNLLAPPPLDSVRTRALDWVAAQGVADQNVLEQVGKLWAQGDEAPSAQERFDALLETFRLVDPAAEALLAVCSLQTDSLFAPEQEAAAVFSADDADAFFQANMRAFYGRYLSQRRMYEEALDVFAEVDLNHIVDPAGYLFYQAVCQHRLLMKDEGLATIKRLLTNTEDVPVRYSTVASLMEYDLAALEEKTLDEIARKMSDVERRLDLGHGGQRVQKVEDEIIASLDELIEKLEAQGGGGGGGGGSDGENNSNQSGGAADDSRVKGATAPGEVDRKRIGTQDGWGALPAKDRTRSKNEIDQKYPAHYRQAIDEYFKKQSNRRANTGR